MKMSADSYQKNVSSSLDGPRSMPNIVPPTPIVDRTILESVAGFISDVALTNAPIGDQTDVIQWVKFETLTDISDISLGDDWDVEGNLPPPLLLVLGYGNGIQVWAIPANGEAIEVMSWKHGVVKIMRILPTPFLSSNNELTNDLLDQFIHKRPLIALVGDSPTPNQHSNANQQYNSVNFVSLKDGDIAKCIKFKTPIVDIVANRTSVAITFAEKIAVFDARTLESRLTITTCYPCPGGLCPIALGDRWMGYAERRLITSKISAGGCYFEGVPSYTATVLNAAKSLGKGLRELGEQVAAGLTGNNQMSNVTSQSSTDVNADGSQPGIVTIIDIRNPINDISPTTGTPVAVNGNDPIIAHFVAHTEAIVCLAFDPSGTLCFTADRRGHDFNIFKIHPHPSGSVLAAVHHLYVLHRGDTSAKVQDVSFSFDSRWIAVSTLRGTTHVFPITPYGGAPALRTHSQPHVVNRLSRFHRSAGLHVADNRSGSPILMAEHAPYSTTNSNPRLPPFPHPTVVNALAQLRQPCNITSTPLTSLVTQNNQNLKSKKPATEEVTNSRPLRVASIFAKSRSWLLDPPGFQQEPTIRYHRKAVDSLFVIAAHGALMQFDLEPRAASTVPKEKICDESPIELVVVAKAQWTLGVRSPLSVDMSPPLSAENWLIKDRIIDNNLNMESSQIENISIDDRDDRWLSQVEIVTHAGPHRRLWMGPQFSFKIYNTPSGLSLAHIDTESVDVRTKSTPMNISHNTTKSLIPVLIESELSSSHEQSPHLADSSFHYECHDTDVVLGPDSQLREDLADAMKDDPAISGIVNNMNNMNPTTLIKHLNNENIDGTTSNNVHSVVVSFVDSRGAITNIVSREYEEATLNEDTILENCDETVFRPVVTVFSELDDCSEQVTIKMNENFVQTIQPELIVPVIDEKIMLECTKKRESVEKQIEIPRPEVTKDFEIEKVVSKKSKKTRKSSNKTVNIEANKIQIEKTPEPEPEPQPKIIIEPEIVVVKAQESVVAEIKDDYIEQIPDTPEIEIEVITEKIVEEEITSNIESFDVVITETETKLDNGAEEEDEKLTETPPEVSDNIEILTSKKSKRNRRNKKNSNNNNNNNNNIINNSEICEEQLTPADVIDSPIEIIEDDLNCMKQFEIINDELMKEEDQQQQQESTAEMTNFYDLEDELALAPLSSFDAHFSDDSQMIDEKCDENQHLKSKISEVVKNTNMIFAMCSSLKDVIDTIDEDVKSTSSLSQIQRSTSSTTSTTNTTTSTFASASSIQTGEGIESDYKSFEIDAEISDEMKVNNQQVVESSEDNMTSSAENATSSETDDNSLRPTLTKIEDDEELRPLLQTSINSLSSPLLEENQNQNTEIVEENCEFPPLEDPNPKSTTTTNNSNNGRNRRNKKKRR